MKESGSAVTFRNVWHTGHMRGRRGGSSGRSCSSSGTVCPHESSHCSGVVMSVENPGHDACVRGAPHPQQQIELEPSPGRVQRAELRHLDLLQPNVIRGHMNMLAQKREQARDEVSIAEMNPHVPQEDAASSSSRIREGLRLTVCLVLG